MSKFRLRISLIKLITALLFAVPLSAPLAAEASGLAADTLTVSVGYFGGPYYEKRVFTVDELWSMNVQYIDYTFIDNMPSVVIDHVAGVSLAEVVEAAGIDIGSVQSFNFWTNDKSGGYYTTMTKTALIDTPRYCYYSLPDNFDYDTGMGNEFSTLDGAPVPAMLALEDDWQRVLAGASFGSDYMNLSPDTRFRLVYGQTDAVTRTASESAKWIHSIEVTLGGAPTLTAGADVLDLMVGSAFRSEARVNAADPIIVENAVIQWSSGDENVATVDANGEITVHSEGSAVITGSYGGAEIRITVNGSAGDGGEDTSGESGVSGEDEENSNGADSQGENSGQEGTPQPSNTSAPNSQTPSTLAPNTPEPNTTTAPEPATPTEEISSDVPASNEEPIKTVLLGREISILGASEASGNDDGGVQNWRSGEMADLAVELPNINEDSQAGAKLGVVAGALFMGSAAVRVTVYYFGIKEKSYVVKRNTKQRSSRGG